MTGQRTPSPQMSVAVTLYPPGTAPPVSPWWHWMESNNTTLPSGPNTGENTLTSGRCPPPW